MSNKKKQQKTSDNQTTSTPQPPKPVQVELRNIQQGVEPSGTILTQNGDFRVDRRGNNE